MNTKKCDARVELPFVTHNFFCDVLATVAVN